MTPIQTFAQQVSANVAKVIVGNEDAVQSLTIALLCEGHVLLEDVPGVGKTMLARALSISLGVDFRRLQCPPDLLPSDIICINTQPRARLPAGQRSGPLHATSLLSGEAN